LLALIQTLPNFGKVFFGLSMLLRWGIDGKLETENKSDSGKTPGLALLL
jgi:hypothetical protein